MEEGNISRVNITYRGIIRNLFYKKEFIIKSWAATDNFLVLTDVNKSKVNLDLSTIDRFSITPVLQGL